MSKLTCSEGLCRNPAVGTLGLCEFHAYKCEQGVEAANRQAKLAEDAKPKKPAKVAS